MKTFLFTWNPKKYEGEELWIVEDDIEIRGESYPIEWSCGNTKKPQSGDRFFFLRQGENPRGIIGSGYIVSSPFKEKHWDKDKSEVSTTNFVETIFEEFTNGIPLLSIEALQEHPLLKNHCWTPQGSGTEIPEPYSSALEEIWFQRTGKSTNTHLTESKEYERVYIEGKVNTVQIKKYERNPHARKKCIEHHGVNCYVCGFNFENVYGAQGKDFIHVHHKESIAEKQTEYRVDPINDLVPICPNCHAMIHTQTPPLSIEALQNIIKQTNNVSV